MKGFKWLLTTWLISAITVPGVLAIAEINHFNKLQGAEIGAALGILCGILATAIRK
jgi:hypothetical protein